MAGRFDWPMFRRKSGNADDWRLPYLIEMTSGRPSMVVVDFPDKQVIQDTDTALGDVAIPLGGTPMLLKRELVQQHTLQLCDPLRASLFADTGSPPDLIRSDAVLVVSRKFRDVVEPFVDNTEFIPLEVTLKSNAARLASESELGTVRDDYLWMNCWKRLDLIDPSRSELALIPDWARARQGASPTTFSSWTKLHLGPLPTDVHLFGLKGLYGGRRFLSERLHQEIVNAGLRVGFDARMLDLRPGAHSNEEIMAHQTALNTPWTGRG